MKIPFPNSPRELFELFKFYDSDKGLDELLSQVDLNSVSQQQIYYAVHGRLPESAKAALGGTEFMPHHWFRAALVSQEFQTNVIRLFLNAFPDKKRLIFIHIPKCAGTHLYARLRDQYPYLPASIQEPEWANRGDLFDRLRILAGEADDKGSSIFVYGHTPLVQYIDEKLLRPTDALFTVVRDPIDIMLSRANHYVTRLADDPEFRSPDTKQWAELFELDSRTFDPTEQYLTELAHRILHDREQIPDNIMCRFLGGTGDRLGTSATFSDALDKIARTNIEITDTNRYNTWLQEKWNINSGAKENVSRRYLTVDSLDAGELAYLKKMTVDDRELYDRIVMALDATSVLSISGTLFARLFPI